jgi:ketosteroid isomerase-like protein
MVVISLLPIRSAVLIAYNMDSVTKGASNLILGRVEGYWMAQSSLANAFDALVGALAKGDLDGFYGVMAQDAVILDEDLPFRVDKAGFQAHIAFHGPDNWEGFAWKPTHVQMTEQGSTGMVMGFAMFRGKPRGAGFRLRPMQFSQGWVRRKSGWQLISWHQSPIIGHVTRQSPG